MKQITAPELAQWLSSATADPSKQPQLLDVREPWEFNLGHLDGSLSIPMGRIAERSEELDPGRPIVCICHHGARSMQVALFLEARGCSEVCNLMGGVNAWALQVDPKFPKY